MAIISKKASPTASVILISPEIEPWQCEFLRPLVQELEKTQIASVRSMTDFPEDLANAKRVLGETPICQLFVCAHGNDAGDGFWIDLSKFTDYTIEKVEKRHFDPLDPLCKIFLLVCNAGRAGGIGSAIASASQREVIAPEGLASISPTEFVVIDHQIYPIFLTEKGEFCARLIDKSSNRRFPTQREIEALQACKKNPQADRLLTLFSERGGLEVWMRKRAEEGFAWSQCFFGYRLLEQGKTQEGLQWLQRSAEQGYPVGQYNLGIALSTGYGIREDRKMALHWLQKAADQNYVEAYYRSGLIYLQEPGANLFAALDYLKKAAGKGHAMAQMEIHRLGRSFGIGNLLELYENMSIAIAPPSKRARLSTSLKAKSS